ncbi:hypothetical protein [Paenibacillus sp. GCM10028914]|uniref:hypothetical protein n=1 Tax=Paenibacillus sp. GCM10028914 TaxID=3273416 RepID=UPI00361EF416
MSKAVHVGRESRERAILLSREAAAMTIDQLIALLALIVMIIGLAVNKSKS